jgi:CheY-like chemotaxis protein
VGAALDGFSRRVADRELGGIVGVQDRRGFEDEVARLKSAGIDPPLASAAAAVAPLQQWVESLRQELAPQLESARALRQLASQVRPFVLAVDDDPFQHRMLAQMFHGTEIDLACVLTGAEALGLMRRRRPDLVLTDIELPDIDGISITKRMRASPQLAAVPVMMITGHSEKHLIVVKPFDKATVMAKVSRLLRLREPWAAIGRATPLRTPRARAVRPSPPRRLQRLPARMKRSTPRCRRMRARPPRPRAWRTARQASARRRRPRTT